MVRMNCHFVAVIQTRLWIRIGRSYTSHSTMFNESTIRIRGIIGRFRCWLLWSCSSFCINYRFHCSRHNIRCHRSAGRFEWNAPTIRSCTTQNDTQQNSKFQNGNDCTATQKCDVMRSIPFVQRFQATGTVSCHNVFVFLQRLTHRQIFWFRIQMWPRFMTIS